MLLAILTAVHILRTAGERSIKAFHPNKLLEFNTNFEFFNNNGDKIFSNMMKKRKVFSSKNEEKFRFISKLVITFSMGGFWVYFWYKNISGIRKLLCLNDSADI